MTGERKEISHWLGNENLFCSWKHMFCRCACLFPDMDENWIRMNCFGISFKFICFSSLQFSLIFTVEIQLAYMKFNKNKRWLCTWDGQIVDKCKLGDKWLESSSTEKDLGIQLTVSLTWASSVSWQPGVQTTSWSVKLHQCLKGIWTMLLKCFKFWSVLRWSGSWTRWLL